MRIRGTGRAWINWQSIFGILLIILGTFVFREKAVADELNPITIKSVGVELSIYPFGSVVKSRIWNTKEIPVCWENPDAIDEQLKKVSEEAIKNTWARHSSLTFPGWGACAKGQLGVHIYVASELPHVKTIGRYLNGKPRGVILNFEFEKWRPACSESPENLQRCVRAMVVHEFGHVIGFAHEHIRPDSPVECKAEKRGTRGTWNVTKYDDKSVMNYCTANWLGDGQLSALDITAIKTVYDS